MLIIALGQEANRYIVSIFHNMKVCCVFSLESPHRGDSNEYTQYHFQYKKENLNYPKSAAMGFFPRDSSKRVISGKRVISVRITEGLLYLLRSRGTGGVATNSRKRPNRNFGLATFRSLVVTPPVYHL